MFVGDGCHLLSIIGICSIQIHFHRHILRSSVPLWKSHCTIKSSSMSRLLQEFPHDIHSQNLSSIWLYERWNLKPIVYGYYLIHHCMVTSTERPKLAAGGAPDGTPPASLICPLLPPPDDPSSTLEVAAGGFWGPQRRFDNVEGVIETVVGYSGSKDEKASNPSYRNIQDCKCRTWPSLTLAKVSNLLYPSISHHSNESVCFSLLF